MPTSPRSRSISALNGRWRQRDGRFSGLDGSSRRALGQPVHLGSREPGLAAPVDGPATNSEAPTTAIDLFTAATATFCVRYVSLVFRHDRRRVVHFNVTAHATAEWTARHIVHGSGLHRERAWAEGPATVSVIGAGTATANRPNQQNRRARTQRESVWLSRIVTESSQKLPAVVGWSLSSQRVIHMFPNGPGTG